MSLTPELTADQIDDWFRIGKKAVTVKGIPRSASGGRFIDPETLKPRAPSVPDVPNYKRQPTFHGGCDYAAKYQQEEEERLMERSILGDQSDVASVLSSRLEALEVDSTIAGSSVLPADLAPPNAMDVYNHYSFQPNYDSKLPITHFKEQVIATVESNQVTVIQGATGSGKTTQVAQYILDHYAEQNKYCNIIVTQPRRIAAISIARRVCQERDWQLGTVCGYQVGLEKNASSDTRILYCTTGILLNKLINEKNMHQYSHVILDEVHERDQNTDFCLLVVRKLLRTNSQHTRVILMSATFDSDMFAQYFALPVCDRLEQAPVVNVQGKPYRVSEFYAEDLQKLGEVPTLEEADPSISLQSKQLALKLVEEFDKMEEKEQGLSHTGFAPIRGTVLMFLPGLAEITSLEEALVKMKERHRLFIIPLHSTITMDEQNNVFCQPAPGIRKVILSTNIAESSITVPDIKYVIDFCLTKNLETDFETNYTSLQISWASKANCIQRKGRAGRVSNGRVYRLVTRYFYETFFQDYTKPEMQRCPLDKLILQVKVLNLGEPKAILALALSPPNLDDIERNILLLKEIGALANSVISHYGVNKHDGELTFVGRVLADLPVDTKIGKLLILGHVFGLLDECLIIGASMSQKSVFTKPFKQRLEAYRHKLEWSCSSLSDSLAILYAYKNWQRKSETGEFRRSVGGGEKQWASQHYLQIRRLKEVTELMKELEKHLLKFNIERPRHEPHYKRAFTESQELLLLKVVLCGAFYPNYFTPGEIDELESHKSLSGKNPLNTVMVKGLPASHSHLYKESVEDLFRRYIPNPKASLEETRAYIEFPWRNANKNKVHPGVYLAMKMKQLRMPFTVDISSRGTSRGKQPMSDLQGPAVQHGQVNRDRRTGEVLETYEVGSSRVGKHVPMPRVDQDVVRVFVANVEACGHFWIQYCEPVNFNQLRDIQTALNRDRGLSLRPFSTKLRVGMFCVAPYLDQDEVEYYRGHVISIHNQFDERLQAQREMSEVFYVDYGNTALVPSQELRELPSELLNQPFQAVECQLIKVRPSPIKCPDGRWTHEANEVFRQTVLNQELYIRPFSVVHGLLRVELVHTSPFQYYVSQKLIEEGYADETEESNLSKQINEQRIEEFAVMRSQSTERNRDPKVTPRTLADAAAEARQFSGSHPLLGEDKGNTRITLTGPSNPYEMSFNSLTSVGRLRSVRIEQDSVNSICVDDEPYTPNQRLMVAGFVGLNSTRSTMLARDATLMPLIPGLAHLIPLIFTPMAEFRIDEQKTKYTGAICGLGTDTHTGQALLPDNDMELVFDVNITHDDLVKINAIRIAINFAIGSRDAVSGWGEGAIYIIQKRARDSLMDLIQKRREPCEVVSPRYPYQWNRLDKDDIMPPSVDKQGMATLLSLHSGVCLENASEETAMPPETERMLAHLKHLREVVRQKKVRQLIVCELCNVPCPSHQLLALHLETQRHKTAEEALLKPSRQTTEVALLNKPSR